MHVQPTKTEAIKRFLTLKTVPDLAELYNHDMECQVNVARDGGMPITGDFQGRQWMGWSDGITTWKPIRVPWNAMTQPEFEDSEMRFSLEDHAEGIGMTGWDWKNQLSLWVGFDFDAIAGHSDKHARRNTQEELQQIQEKLSSIPWVTLRYSTSGKGLHLYVFLEPVSTETHTEHQAVARAILNMLAGLTGFDFSTKVDVCGSNMWVWHRKMRGTRGLQRIKNGTLLSQIPDNWRDHLNVITGRRRKNVPNFVEAPESQTLFEELTGQRPRIPLDQEHRKLIEWLTENCGTEHTWWWDADHHMLVTHTALLKRAHDDLNLRGIFETSTRDSTTHNCFAFPLRRGAWSIRRYTPGVGEHSSWTQDGSSYTRCFYNRDPDLASLARSFGGSEAENGSFIFSDAQAAQEVGLILGAEIKLPPAMSNRKTTLKAHKDGRLIAEVEKQPNDNMSSEAYPGWIPKSKTWFKIFGIKATPPKESSEVADYDDLVRHLVTSTDSEDEDSGWVIKAEGHWTREPIANIKTALLSMDITRVDVDKIIGNSVFRHWRLVNLPFQPEYPGDRTWNKGASQLRFAPSLNRDELYYPTWLKILQHIGKGLDSAVRKHPWCQANNILTGADYIKCWCASVFQYPTEPLPYLFLYGPQNSGKSILHEALSLLVTHGVVRADNALVNTGGFNGELQHAILAVVEEIDLSQNKNAYNRIKDWVNARSLPIHPKNGTPFTIPNATHWLQCANPHTSCPVTIGDTRITMIYVGSIQGEIIPKRHIIPMLEKEAPDFLAALLSVEIPESNDRLMLPIIDTDVKIVAARANKSKLELFIESECHVAPGESILYSDFVQKFQAWLDTSERFEWTKARIGRSLPPEFPHARSLWDSGQFHIGNLSYSPQDGTQSKKPLIIRIRGKNDYLVPEDYID
jgi:hypothetical protein